jgi:hypothetical protein
MREKKYLVDYRKVEWNRVVWHDKGYAAEVNTILEPMSSDRPMLELIHTLSRVRFSLGQSAYAVFLFVESVLHPRPRIPTQLRWTSQTHSMKTTGNKVRRTPPDHRF